MPLPQFDLVKAIQDYNQKNGKNIKADETFGYPFFDKKILESCEQMIASISNEDLLYLSQEISEHHSMSDEMRIYAKTTKDSIPAIREHVSQFKQSYDLWIVRMNSKRSLSEWRKNQYALFQDTDHWLSFVSSDNVSLNRLNELKNYWKKQALFAQHSAQAIFKIASEWLPGLIDYHEEVLRNLKWHYFAMPREIYNAYQNYLKGFLVEAKALQLQLAETMLERLKILDATSFKHANIIVHLANVLKLNSPATPRSEKLTAQQFSYFHNYIQQRGNQHLKEQLHHLSWFKPNSNLPMQAIKTKNSLLIVPQVLKEDIPLQKKKPNWLFHGANLRYKFYQQHAADFAELQQLSNLDQLEINSSNFDLLQEGVITLQARQKITEKLFAELEKPLYSDLGFWQGKTKHFVEKCKQLLQAAYQQILETQMILAEKIAKCLLVDSEPFLSALDMDKKAGKILSMLLQNLTQSMQKNNCFFELMQRVQRLQKYNSGLMVNGVLALLETVGQGTLINKDDLSHIKITLADNKNTQHPVWKRLMQAKVVAISEQLKKALKQNPNEMKDKNESLKHSNTICQCHAVLQLLNQSYDLALMTKLLERYFYYYVNTILSCGNKAEAFVEKATLLNNFEQVMELFPQVKEIMIGNLL